MAQYKDPMAMDGNPAPSTALEDGEESVEKPAANTFWIPGDALGGKCKAGDVYRIEATADPDEDGDVPFKLVSEESSGKAKPEEEDDSDMRMAFADKSKET